MSQPVPFWERSLRYRKLSAEVRAVARKAQDDYTKQTLMELADGWQKLAEVFAPTTLYWDRLPANENTLPLREGRNLREQVSGRGRVHTPLI